ncbi:MAG: zinc metallopeptidase [Thermostichales cyanobacterium BF4_bins_65]
MYWHWTYWLVLPGVLVMLWAQNQVQSTYRRYARVPSSLGMTGAEVARVILRRMGVAHVGVEMTPGELSDHYDPQAKMVRLSPGIYNSASLAAAAVAAHECGHVLQDQEGYAPMVWRANLVPLASLGSQLGPVLVVLGIVLTGLGAISSLFIHVGIALFVAAIAFHLITLPVEFDASARALRLIDRLGILQGQEHRGAKAVLDAAAWTYVAGALYAVLQLIQLLIMSRER